MVKTARLFLGMPFKRMGKNRLGIDCLGLVVLCAQKQNMLLDFVWPQRLYPPFDEVKALLLKHTKPVALSATRKGDIGLFYEGKTPRHLAIITGEGTIVHASQSLGRVVEEPFNESWQQKLYGVFRLKKAQ